MLFASNFYNLENISLENSDLDIWVRICYFSPFLDVRAEEKEVNNLPTFTQLMSGVSLPTLKSSLPHCFDVVAIAVLCI